ncbi:MAG: lipid-A-disaccharide synthase [Pseudomonadales bacterium]
MPESQNDAPSTDASITIVLVAGEDSGDNLGAPLIRKIKRQYPNARFMGIGGPLMIKEGLESWFDIDQLSVNGFIDPIKRFPSLLKILLTLRSRILKTPPDCFVGIDFNFFNLLLEGLVKKRGIKTAHYVSPTIWAWRSGRIKGIKKNVDLMLTLYPFENEIYEEHDVGVKFVGHPKSHEIGPDTGARERSSSRQLLGYDENDEIIAILPGSRSSEVSYSGPDFFAAAKLIGDSKPSCKFVVPAANAKRMAQIKKMLEEFDLDVDLQLIEGQSREAMTAADVVLVNSGTATLEALLLKRPMVMSYRLGKLTYRIVSRLARTKYFALPNVLAGRELIPEFIQSAATPENLSEAVLNMFNPDIRDSLLGEFDKIHKQLRLDSGSVAADAIIGLCLSENSLSKNNSSKSYGTTTKLHQKPETKNV